MVNLNEIELLERTLRFSDDVGHDSINKLLEKIMVLQKSNTEKEIVLHMCSGGGNPNTAVSFYETIKIYDVNLHMISSGICGSAALTMFVSGRKRSAASNATRFLAHPIRTTVNGKFTNSELRDLLQEQEVIEKNCIDILKKESKISDDDFNNLYYNERSSTAAEMKRFGFIHEILT